MGGGAPPQPATIMIRIRTCSPDSKELAIYVQISTVKLELKEETAFERGKKGTIPRFQRNF